MQPIRIIEIPDCKMVSSGVGLFGEEQFDRFFQWFSSQPVTMHPKDFLSFSYDEKGEFNGMLWFYLYEEGMDAAGFDVVDFKGGPYAVATDIDQKTDMKAMGKSLDKFLKAGGFVRDHSRPELGNIITPPAVREILGYSQMDYYTPIKAGGVGSTHD